MYYQIKDTLTTCSAEDITNRKIPYVANISLEEFEEKKSLFDMGIDLDLESESDDITEIGSFAFEGCANLRSIVLPSGITRIDLGTFWDCKKLTSVKMPPLQSSVQ